MTDDNSNLVDIPEDLTSFKALFEGREAPKVEDNEDDALATDDDTDASQEDEAEDHEDSEAEDQDEDSEDESEEDSEDSDEDEPETEPKDKGKKPKSRYQTRIDELTRTAREAERREAALLSRLEALETKNRPVQEDSPQESITDTLPPGAPKPDDVDAKGVPKYPLNEFDPAFIRDMTVFSIKQELKAADEERTRSEALRQQAAQVDVMRNEWNQKLEAAEEEIPDIREHIADLVTVFQNVEPAYGEYLASIIMTSENGPAVMEYLSQNIGEAQKIVASGPTAATLAIGRLEARLQNITNRPDVEEKRNKKPSKAPAPPAAVTRGSKGGKQTVREDTEDLAAFKRDFFK